LRFLVLILTIIYNMDSRCCNKSSPSQMHLDFYMPYFYSSDFLCLHHSLTLAPHIIYLFLKQHIYSVKSLLQWNSTMTSLVVQMPTRRKKTRTKKNMLPRSFILPLILPSTINYANLFSMQKFLPPSIARCKSCSP
jgi:hypothetical protein